jgi:site-specific DNA-methyltransferase (adenine-specific)
MHKVINGNSIDKLKALEADSVDTIITDPPYGLSFMGKKWDYDVPSVDLWKEALRVLKPGGTALIFAGSRTQHRMAVNVEDAGFILKDCIMWLYGSGFPKATDISKQLDKGHEREVIGKSKAYRENAKSHNIVAKHEYSGQAFETTPATPEAKLWEGWKSHGLKPAYEPILVAVKPNDGTYAENALKHGVSGLNIDGGRIPTHDKLGGGGQTRDTFIGKDGWDRPWRHDEDKLKEKLIRVNESVRIGEEKGRFPANIILDEEAGRLLDEQSGESKSSATQRNNSASKNIAMSGDNLGHTSYGHNDKGDASRFFYCAKASKKERNAGCEGIEEKNGGMVPERKEAKLNRNGKNPILKNNHPTVKPIALMEYLCTLTKTPTGGTVLDPFMGSGTTGVAAINTQRDFIGIELSEEYIKIAEARLNHAQTNKATD